MKSEWKVASNYLDDRIMYAVYRLRNTAEADHSGNRELATGYMDSREEAAAIAERMNEEEKTECERIDINENKPSSQP